MQAGEGRGVAGCEPGAGGPAGVARASISELLSVSRIAYSAAVARPAQ